MSSIDLYDGHYGQLAVDVQTAVRRETYGEDLGQASWTTVAELRQWLPRLHLDRSKKLLEVACGSGGVTCWLAREGGASCIGVDINPHGIDAAKRLAASQGISALASFQTVDASRPLPFDDQSFDALFCNDAINHLPGRADVLHDWQRVLRPGGRLLFTDPIVVTGQLSNEEIQARSSIGFFLFTPAGVNERLLQAAGFTLVETQDVTEAVATVSSRWREARSARREQLLLLEGEETFEGLQRFLSAAHTLANERRLSRFVYVAARA